MSRTQVALALILAMTTPVCALAQGAELAIRWDPADGGPKSLSEVQGKLGLADGKEKSFEVRYLAVDQPGGAVRAIARERRQKNGDVEAMYKLRGPETARASIEKSGCPLAATKPEFKLEYDVTWTLNPASPKHFQRVRALSWSCTVEASAEQTIPSSFHARPLPCASTMRRTKSGPVKMEHWTLPSGRQVFEVSMDAASPNEWMAFETAVAKPLVQAKARPLKQGMTELGSACPA